MAVKFRPDMRSEDYFSSDYATASRRFRSKALENGACLERIELDVNVPNGDALGIDIAWIGAQRPRRVLVHSSGLHGVEGFAGSAIQLQLLERLPQIPADAALVVVHILNPFGMAYLRRVNENNVDLNRNFRSDGSYRGAPPRYSDALLNPQTPPAFDFFLLRIVLSGARHGIAAMKQSIVEGQYEFPQGLFFGGKQREEGPRKYESFLRSRLSEAEHTIFIDVHTGLGKFANHMLLVEQTDYETLRKLFGERVTALQPYGGSGYSIEGGIESMLFRSITRNRPIFICQEFGTYNGIRVLHALREENRWHHFHGGEKLDHYSKQYIKETFCPKSEHWRSAVLKQGSEVLERAIQVLLSAVP